MSEHVNFQKIQFNYFAFPFSLHFSTRIRTNYKRCNFNWKILLPMPKVMLLHMSLAFSFVNFSDNVHLFLCRPESVMTCIKFQLVLFGMIRSRQHSGITFVCTLLFPFAIKITNNKLKFNVKCCKHSSEN